MRSGAAAAAAASACPPLPPPATSSATGLQWPQCPWTILFLPRRLSPVSSRSPAATTPSSSHSIPPPRTALPRRALLSAAVSAAVLPLAPPPTSLPSSAHAAAEFVELEGSGGVKVLDLRTGEGKVPTDGDEVAIHYYGRLAAKRGWRFDSTYDHKDKTGEPVPFVFVVGSGKVIPGINVAVKTMKVGGIRRIVIPPSQGYQSTSQEPLPPNYFDRQRLFTTIFNPTRLNNGEGSTLGTLIFDIELLSLRHL